MADTSPNSTNLIRRQMARLVRFIEERDRGSIIRGAALEAFNQLDLALEGPSPSDVEGILYSAVGVASAVYGATGLVGRMRRPALDYLGVCAAQVLEDAGGRLATE